MRTCRTGILVFVLAVLSWNAAKGGVEEDVRGFVSAFETAYNARDLKTVSDLTAGTSLAKAVSDATNDDSTVALRVVSVDERGGISATVEVKVFSKGSGQPRLLDTDEMVFAFARDGQLLRLRDARSPSTEALNNEMELAAKAGRRFADEVSRQGTNALMRWVRTPDATNAPSGLADACKAQGLEWAFEAACRGDGVRLSGVTRMRQRVIADFSVSNTTSGGSAKQQAVYATNTFYGTSSQRKLSAHAR